MKIRIPDKDGVEQYIENKNSIVLVGANGSGKTRMSVWIDDNNHINTHRVSAQKSLNMPQAVSPADMDKASEMFIYGTTNDNKDWLERRGKRNGRWGQAPETHMLNDFQELMVVLETENYEKSIEFREKHLDGKTDYKNETKLERIKAIWEDVITHKRLKLSAGKIEVFDSSDESMSDLYSGSDMSDGERAIFYFIGEVICAEKSQLIIIDEPENHLHNAILVRLWDAIEKERPDCVFLYITHDLHFASSRLNSQVLWVKNMKKGPVWDYELLDDIDSNLNLRLDILGSRQKVMLVEGKENSIDRKLYAKLFPEYNIIPLESCEAVIQTVKSFKRIENLHHAEVVGIVDRDRRSDEEVEKLNKDNIVVPLVAEVENLFVLPEVIRFVADRLKLDEDVESLTEEITTQVIQFLKDNIEEQVLLFVRQRCANTVNETAKVKVETIDEYDLAIKNMAERIDVASIASEVRVELNEIIENNDYLTALRVINNKGLISNLGISNRFGWKKNAYVDYVIRQLDAEGSETVRDAIKKYIPFKG